MHDFMEKQASYWPNIVKSCLIARRKVRESLWNFARKEPIAQDHLLSDGPDPVSGKVQALRESVSLWFAIAIRFPCIWPKKPWLARRASGSGNRLEPFDLALRHTLESFPAIHVTAYRRYEEPHSQKSYNVRPAASGVFGNGISALISHSKLYCHMQASVFRPTRCHVCYCCPSL